MIAPEPYTDALMKEPSEEIYAVLMAGGSGTRFWPASRRARPKQYLPIGGEEPLLRQTFLRLSGLVDRDRVLVVSAAGQEAAVRACLPELPQRNLLFEPKARNTAACVAYAALEIERRDPDAVQLVMPADHVIDPPEKLRATLAAGAALARTSGALVTFGIRPTYPATGFGYIEQGDAHPGQPEQSEHLAFRVSRFVEKPDLRTAQDFLASGKFLWNAGIFAWTSRSILEAFESLASDISVPLRSAVGDPARLAQVYPELRSTPVDVAILERAQNVLTVPIDYAWNDVGSWAALAELGPPDASGNWRSLGPDAELVLEDSTGCVTWAEGDDLIALIGVQDLIVVRAGDATLVCPRDRAQDVKRIVEQLSCMPRGERRL